jgi:cytochrome c oxidase subunit 2
MKHPEAIPLIVTLSIMLGLPGGALAYEYLVRPAMSPHRTVEIHASVPQNGGFGPDVIRVNKGETVTLRFTSRDVTHGVAIGPGMDVDLGQIDPGHAAEVTVTFDQPGQFTYYCNTWCSNDHWRMRGVIEVVDPTNPDLIPAAQYDPIIEMLVAEGVDIDKINRRPEQPDATTASAKAGKELIDDLIVPPEMEAGSWRRSHTPQQALDMLATANPAIPKSRLMDAVAHLWVREFDPVTLQQAQILYQKNCSGCHGETGGADGPGADLASSTPLFSLAIDALPRRSDVMYAKIRRGGMGTGMPNWGTVFTPDETLGLVDYLWTLAFGSPNGN